MPVSVRDFVDEKHLATFELSVVRDELHMAKILSCYSGEKGQPPFFAPSNPGAARTARELGRPAPTARSQRHKSGGCGRN